MPIRINIDLIAIINGIHISMCINVGINIIICMDTNIGTS